MGYYMAGDYYAAGGIFGTIGKAIGGIAKTVGGLVPGPVGGVISGIGGAITKISGGGVAKVPTPTLSLPAAPTGITGAIGVKMGPIQINPLAAIPGGAPLVSAPAGMGAPAGYHLNKSYSYARGMPAGSFYVKNRRMNPANPRALRRGIRREKAFVALARHVLKGTGLSVSRRQIAKKSTRRR